MRKVVENNIYNMLDLIQVCSIPYKITIKSSTFIKLHKFYIYVELL